jgi:hypothetical protein
MTHFPRGIRNNNPGNIRYDGTPWLGLDMPPSDGAFCRFTDAKYGIRAMAKIIENYDKKYGLNTIGQIIFRWAPPVENNSGAYANAVASALRVDPNAPLDLASVMPELCRAIIRHENGECPYSDEEIKKGIAC